MSQLRDDDVTNFDSLCHHTMISCITHVDAYANSHFFCLMRHLRLSPNRCTFGFVSILPESLVDPCHGWLRGKVVEPVLLVTRWHARPWHWGDFLTKTYYFIGVARLNIEIFEKKKKRKEQKIHAESPSGVVEATRKPNVLPQKSLRLWPHLELCFWVVLAWNLFFLLVSSVHQRMITECVPMKHIPWSFKCVFGIKFSQIPNFPDMYKVHVDFTRPWEGILFCCRQIFHQCLHNKCSPFKYIYFWIASTTHS